MKKTLWLKTVLTNKTISLMEPTTVIVAISLNLMAADTTTVAVEVSLHALRMMTAVTKNAADLQVGVEALQAAHLKVAALQAVVAHVNLKATTTETLTQTPLLKSISQP